MAGREGVEEGELAERKDEGWWKGVEEGGVKKTNIQSTVKIGNDGDCRLPTTHKPAWNVVNPTDALLTNSL